MEILNLLVCISEDGVVAFDLLAVGGCLLTLVQPFGSEALRFGAERGSKGFW